MRYAYLTSIVVLVASVLVFQFQNLERVTVSFLNAGATMPLSMLVILINVLGMLTGGSLLSLVKTWVRGGGRQRDDAGR